MKKNLETKGRKGGKEGEGMREREGGREGRRRGGRKLVFLHKVRWLKGKELG